MANNFYALFNCFSTKHGLCFRMKAFPHSTA